MTVSFDEFIKSFLLKITEYKFLKLRQENREAICEQYMKQAAAKFSELCVYDLANYDSEGRCYNFEDATNVERDEIVDIVSDGMVYQWLSQHMYKQENLENMLTTSDYSAYSPAELTYRITNAYEKCGRKFTNAMREYSFRHGDLTNLHL